MEEKHGCQFQNWKENKGLIQIDFSNIDSL